MCERQTGVLCSINMMDAVLDDFKWAAPEPIQVYTAT